MLATLAAALLSLSPAAANGDGLQLGALTFRRCELSQPNSAATTAAWCAPFSRPENPEQPQGRRIEFRLALIRSEVAAVRPDPIVLLAGGPGQAASENWNAVAAALALARRERHVILLDQRGTGGSNALRCEAPQTEAAADAAAVVDAAAARKYTADCLGQLKDKADPAWYTTTEAVADLEALRQALGGVKFNLLGISYGTRVAQQYARRHPDGVRSLILDGVVPNELVLGADFARSLDDSLRGRFALCAQDEACNRRFGDIHATLYALRRQLREQPLKVALRDPLTFAQREEVLDAETYSSLVRLYAYAPETAALLPLTVERAHAGDAAPMFAQLRMLERDLESLGENAMQYSVACAEDAPWLEPRAQDADTVLGSMLADVFRETCTVWPRGTRAADFAEPVRGDTPVLLLAGEFDPITPPRYAERIAAALPNSRVLVAKGQGHSVMGRGCLPRLVGEFVADLDPAQLDAGCVADFGPLPAFLDFNGAAP